jgi:hypothetical protein
MLMGVCSLKVSARLKVLVYYRDRGQKECQLQHKYLISHPVMLGV